MKLGAFSPYINDVLHLVNKKKAIRGKNARMRPANGFLLNRLIIMKAAAAPPLFFIKAHSEIL